MPWLTNLIQKYLRPNYFQIKRKFVQQTVGIPMGSRLFSIVASTFIETSEAVVLESSSHKPKCWLGCIYCETPQSGKKLAEMPKMSFIFMLLFFYMSVIDWRESLFLKQNVKPTSRPYSKIYENFARSKRQTNSFVGQRY